MKLPQLPNKEPISGLLTVPWLSFFTNLLGYIKELPTQSALDTVSQVASDNLRQFKESQTTEPPTELYYRWVEVDTVSQPITTVYDSVISTETLNTIEHDGDLQIDSYLYINELAVNLNPNLAQVYIRAYKNDIVAALSTDAAVFFPGYSASKSDFMAVLKVTTFIGGVIKGDVITLEITGQCEYDNKIEVGIMNSYMTIFKK